MSIDSTDCVDPCSFCLEDFTDPVTGPCGHALCRDCALTWLAKKPECPTCRSPMDAEELRPLTPTSTPSRDASAAPMRGAAPTPTRRLMLDSRHLTGEYARRPVLASRVPSFSSTSEGSVGCMDSPTFPITPGRRTSSNRPSPRASPLFFTPHDRDGGSPVSGGRASSFAPGNTPSVERQRQESTVSPTAPPWTATRSTPPDVSFSAPIVRVGSQSTNLPAPRLPERIRRTSDLSLPISTLNDRRLSVQIPSDPSRVSPTQPPPPPQGHGGPLSARPPSRSVSGALPPGVPSHLTRSPVPQRQDDELVRLHSYTFGSAPKPSPRPPSRVVGPSPTPPTRNPASQSPTAPRRPSIDLPGSHPTAAKLQAGRYMAAIPRARSVVV